MAATIIAAAGLCFLFKEKFLYQKDSRRYNQNVCYYILYVHNNLLKQLVCHKRYQIGKGAHAKQLY